MILHHFTTAESWAKIQAAGAIHPSESNVGSARPDWPPTGEHVGPRVVHLTDKATAPAKSLGLEYSPEHRALLRANGIKVPNKMAVRLVIEIPDYEPELWIDFARRHGAHRQWIRTLTNGRTPENWWIVGRSIALTEITEVH